MPFFDPSLISLAKSFAGAKVALIGDLVCDQFIFGRTKRVSREAPVLILEYENDRLVLGGAANSLNNLRTLGADPLPVGIVGDDETGRELRQIIKGIQVDDSMIVVDPSRPTTVKKRIVGSGLHTTHQQMLRIDYGHINPIQGDVEQKVLEALEAATSACDALLVSDYGYGSISPAVLDAINDIAKSEKIPVLVDSRYRLMDFKHVALFTPNEPEAEEAAKMRIRTDEDVKQAAKIILDGTQAKAICITRGKQGMYLLQNNGVEAMIPIFGSDEIADVTGAGDTVAAVFSAAYANKASLETAARLATVAAGLVVMKAGTATVNIAEIEKALAEAKDG